METTQEPPEGPGNSGKTTRWSVIVRAQGTGPEARAALDTLIRRYESSVVSLIRALGTPPDRAEDLKQEFFTRALERGHFSKLDPTRGRFRGWLRTSVKYFVFGQWQATHPERSAPFTVEQTHDGHPEKLYEQAYARDTILHVLERQRSEHKKPERFDALKTCLPGPELSLPDLATLAETLGTTRSAAAVEKWRAREKFKELLFETVRDTLDLDPSSPDHEIEVLREIRILYRDLCDGPTLGLAPCDE